MKGILSDFMVFPLYKSAVGLAGVFELRLRLLSDMMGINQKLELNEIEEKVLEFFRNKNSKVLDKNVEEFLEKTRQARNKLIHCNFKSLDSRIEAFNQFKNFPKKRNATVQHFNLNDPKNIKPVRESKNAPMFSWVVQLACDGSLEIVAEIFQEACDVLEKLLDEFNSFALKAIETNTPIEEV